jgi:hypothetical protein
VERGRAPEWTLVAEAGFGGQCFFFEIVFVFSTVRFYM